MLSRMVPKTTYSTIRVGRSNDVEIKSDFVEDHMVSRVLRHSESFARLLPIQAPISWSQLLNIGRFYTDATAVQRESHRSHSQSKRFCHQ